MEKTFLFLLMMVCAVLDREATPSDTAAHGTASGAVSTMTAFGFRDDAALDRKGEYDGTR